MRRGWGDVIPKGSRIKNVKKDQKDANLCRKSMYTCVHITLQAEIEQLSLAAVFSERASDDRMYNGFPVFAMQTHHERFTSQDVSCFRDGS